MALQALVSTAAAVCAAGPLYRDATAPVNTRVADLLGRMTTEEKVAQLLNPFSKSDAIVAE